MSGEQHTILTSPTAWLFFVEPALDVVSFLNRVNRKIGQYDGEDGPGDRYLMNYRPAARLPYNGGDRIESASKGILVFEEKQKVDFERIYEEKRPYYVRYYMLDTVMGPMVIISAKRSVARHISRLLSSFGLRSIYLNRRIQDCILSHDDIIDVRKRVVDEMDPGIGTIDLKSPNTRTKLSDDRYARNTDRRGRERDLMAFTWQETAERHRLTFVVNSLGYLYVQHPQVREEWFLDIIDLVLRCVS